LQRLELASKTQRLEAAQGLLYVVCGVAHECGGSSDNQLEQIQECSQLLIASGGFDVLVNYLLFVDQHMQADSKSTGYADWEMSVCINILLVICTSNSHSNRLLHCMANPIQDEMRLCHLLFVILEKFVKRPSHASVPIKKLLLLLFESITLWMGFEEDLTRRKTTRQKLSSRPLHLPKSRLSDVQHMKRRLEQFPATQRQPLALEEALHILERNMHAPDKAQDVPLASTTLRKVIGYKMQTTREVLSKSQKEEEEEEEEDQRDVFPFGIFYQHAYHQLDAFLVSLVKVFMSSLVPQAQLQPNVFLEIHGNDKSTLDIDHARHRSVVLRCCSSTLLLLARLARESHPMQAAYVMHVLADCSFMLLLCKFLKEDIATLCLKPHWIPDPSIHFLYTESQQRPLVNWNYFVTSVSCLRLIQKLTKRSMTRTRIILKEKLSLSLKQLLSCNPIIKIYALKILKSTFRLMKGKHRKKNMDIVTEIYMNLMPELNDDWLTTWYLEQNEMLLVAEEVLHEAEEKAEVAEWNARHFDQEDQEGDDEVDEKYITAGQRLEELYNADFIKPSAMEIESWLESEGLLF